MRFQLKTIGNKWIGSSLLLVDLNFNVGPQHIPSRCIMALIGPSRIESHFCSDNKSFLAHPTWVNIRDSDTILTFMDFQLKTNKKIDLNPLYISIVPLSFREFFKYNLYIHLKHKGLPHIQSNAKLT